MLHTGTIQFSTCCMQGMYRPIHAAYRAYTVLYMLHTGNIQSPACCKQGIYSPLHAAYREITVLYMLHAWTIQSHACCIQGIYSSLHVAYREHTVTCMLHTGDIQSSQRTPHSTQRTPLHAACRGSTVLCMQGIYSPLHVGDLQSSACTWSTVLCMQEIYSPMHAGYVHWTLYSILHAWQLNRWTWKLLHWCRL